MLSKNKPHILFTLIVFAMFAGSAFASDAVVTIQINGQNGIAAFGTGFVASPDGKVVTCYHVVENATKIRIFYRHGVYSAHLIRIAPDRDIVELQMEHVPLPTKYLLTSRILPKRIQSSELIIEGYAAGVFNQRIPARATKGTFVRSAIVKGQHDEPMFKQGEVKLLLLVVTLYNGMSGSPVIASDGHVIGVLSGSFNQGGSIAWAIALENLDSEFTTKVDEPVESFKWPPMTLMNDNWRTLRRDDGVGEAFLDKIEAFTRSANEQEARIASVCVYVEKRLKNTSAIITLLEERPDLARVSLNVLGKNELEHAFGSSLFQLMADSAQFSPSNLIDLDPIFEADKNLEKNYKDLVDAANALEQSLPKTENNKKIKRQLDAEFQLHLRRQELESLVIEMESQKIDFSPRLPALTVGELHEQASRSKLTDEGVRGSMCWGKLMEAAIASETAADFRQLLLADLVDTSN